MRELKFVLLLIIMSILFTGCQFFKGPQGIQGPPGPMGGSGPIIGIVSYIPANAGGVPFCEAFGVGKCEIEAPKCLSGKEVWVKRPFTESSTHTLFCMR